MPSERSTARARTAIPLAVRLLRITADTIVLLVALCCALLLLVRLVVFPRIEAHHEAIAAALEARIGQPVAIGRIVTGWDGWNPKLSIRGFSVADPRNPAVPVLQLPRVDMVIAWTSLPLLELRLRELAIIGARLGVRRDAAGILHVAGMTMDAATRGEDTRLSNWLLRQPRIVVHDGLVTWTDELRDAPQLVLDHVELRIEQHFGQHRFGLTGVPPVELAGPVDLRGQFSRATLGDWRHAHGKAYLRLDYADLAAWHQWLPLPVQVDSGKGALRLWFDFADGKPQAITADVELADVRARLADGLPRLELAHIAGRLGGAFDGARRAFHTAALTFTTTGGAVLPPTDLSWSEQEARDGAPARGELSFDRIELGAVGALAAGLPLPESWRAALAHFAPRGVLHEGTLTFEGAIDDPLRYRAHARLADVAFNAHDAVPGVSGLTGVIEATQAGGSLTVEPHPLTLALPRVFSAPLGFTQAAARIGWSRAGGILEVHVDQASFANDQVAGTAAGSWHAEPAGPGPVDLTAQLTRASVAPLAHYMPLLLDPHVGDWLLRAVVKGHSSDVRLTLRGNLADFPFPQGRKGQFLVAFKAHGGTLDYAEHWPRISDIEADVRFEGARLRIDAASARVLGATLGRTRV
jgi:uncharacterized protein YhdP